MTPNEHLNNENLLKVTWYHRNNLSWLNFSQHHFLAIYMDYIFTQFQFNLGKSVHNMYATRQMSVATFSCHHFN